MNLILKNIVRWFCSRLTENQFHSVLIYLLEIANGEHHDIHFRPEPTSPHFREFSYDQVRPLTSPPDWAQDKSVQKKTGKSFAKRMKKRKGKH